MRERSTVWVGTVQTVGRVFWPSDEGGSRRRATFLAFGSIPWRRWRQNSNSELRGLQLLRTTKQQSRHERFRSQIAVRFMYYAST
jgi:hypothetical protein